MASASSSALAVFALLAILIIFIEALVFLGKGALRKKARMVRANGMGSNLSPMNRPGIMFQGTEMASARKATSLFTSGAYNLAIILLLIVALYVTIAAQSVTIGLLLVAIIIPISLYRGFKAFSAYMVLNNTPTVKIDAAPHGLAEISARIVTKDNDYLLSPISKVKCAYYTLQLHQMQRRGKSTVDVMIGVVQKGVPSMLSDGTGYAAMDFSRAEADMFSNYYLPKLTKDAGNMFQRFVDYVPETRNFLMAVGASDGKSDVLAQDTHIMFRNGKGSLYFLEGYVPLDQDYFAVGGVSPIDKTIDGKPAKMLDVDQEHKMLSFVPEPKTKAMNYLLGHAVMSFFTAVVMAAIIGWLIIALGAI